jgi:hypothetical protein
MRIIAVKKNQPRAQEVLTAARVHGKIIGHATFPQRSIEA